MLNFKRNFKSFLKGVGRILNICPAPISLEELGVETEDQKASENDWEMVGKDLDATVPKLQPLFSKNIAKETFECLIEAIEEDGYLHLYTVSSEGEEAIAWLSIKKIPEFLHKYLWVGNSFNLTISYVNNEFHYLYEFEAIYYNFKHHKNKKYIKIGTGLSSK